MSLQHIHRGFVGSTLFTVLSLGLFITSCSTSTLAPKGEQKIQSETKVDQSLNQKRLTERQDKTHGGNNIGKKPFKETIAATPSSPPTVMQDNQGVIQNRSKQKPGYRDKKSISADALSAPLKQRMIAEKSMARSFYGIGSPMATIAPSIRPPSEPVNREQYAHYQSNPILQVKQQPVSTFSIDVDTGSYTNVRRLLRQGRLPVKDAVRVEEFINYFSYQYPPPESQDAPFNVTTEIGSTPWNPETYLLHVGIKGYDIEKSDLPASNLVFLVDVSGSMQARNKLPLLKTSLKLLIKRMRAIDRLSLVVYAGASGVVLEPTAGSQRAIILHALESLSAGGSTNGGAGIRLAYSLAQQAFITGGINRVILATDGDFNVGTVNFGALKNLVEEKRKTGIMLTTLGFGSGNYNDKLMEQLADSGNGNYAYIDTLNEAQKVLVDEIGSTLHTIAKDVKIQIEFNPTVVAEYRLIGYENRALRREDFNNDKIDAGEIGAGHTVTALYEIALVGSKKLSIDPLRYDGQHRKSSSKKTVSLNNKELAFLRLRYKQPDGNHSKLIETPIYSDKIVKNLSNTSIRFQFAASVAAFGQVLKGGNFTHNYSYADVLSLARKSRGDDPFGYRSEFVSLVNLAMSLSGETHAKR